MKRIALYHIETLLWIDRLGTFGAAAERLNTTQPAISARVRELEGRLGIALFRREGRRMILTVRGRQLVRDWAPLWASIERTFLQIDGFASAGGVVRIGAGEIAAASCLPGFVAEIKAAMPGVALEITVDLTAALLQQLLSGDSDIVFLAGPMASPGIRTRPIGAVALVWLASPATERAMRAGAQPLVWSLPRHSPLHQATMDALDEQGIAHAPIDTCDNVRTLIDIVTVGSGIALFPASMVQPVIASGALIEVLPRPTRAIPFEVAIRTGEEEPVVREIFARAAHITIAPRRDGAPESPTENPGNDPAR